MGNGLACAASPEHCTRRKIWIASYPRSGNTYLRCILHTCFGLPSTSVYPRDLGNNTALERYAGHFDADAGHPDLTGDKPLLVKTHRRPPDDAPAIYIVRDGRAASVSFWEFQSRRRPLPEIVVNRVWCDHVAAWFPWDRPDTLLLRYEEMTGNLPVALRRLSEFLDMPLLASVPPTRAEMAAVDGRWVREYSDWRAKVSQRDMRLFGAINGAMMRRLGYVLDGHDAGQRKRRAGWAHRLRRRAGKVTEDVDVRWSIHYWRLCGMLRPLYRKTRIYRKARRIAAAILHRFRPTKTPVPAHGHLSPSTAQPSAGIAEQRYLRYDEQRIRRHGMNHQLANLRWMLSEAHYAGRLAVLPELTLHPKHNFGIANAWRWDTYFDFDSSRLTSRDGRDHPLPIAGDLPAPVRTTVTVPSGGILDRSAGYAQLVVRSICTGLFWRDVPAKARLPKLEFDIRPSARVSSLARAATVELLARSRGGYTAVHVRRTDRLWGPSRWLTSARRFAAHLGNCGVQDGATVFFLSDERAPDFWASFQSHYDVVRYVDFPDLAALVSTADGQVPDNYLLYEVEKEIMRAATVRVETFPMGGCGTSPTSTLISRWQLLTIRRLRKITRWLRKIVRRLLQDRAVNVGKRLVRRLFG